MPTVSQRDMLMQRRERLLRRSDELRLSIAHEALALRRPLALADRVCAGMRWLQQHPATALGAVALLAAWRPRAVVHWGARLWSGWRVWRGMLGFIAMPRPGPQ